MKQELLKELEILARELGAEAAHNGIHEMSAEDKKTIAEYTVWGDWESFTKPIRRLVWAAWKDGNHA